MRNLLFQYYIFVMSNCSVQLMCNRNKNVPASIAHYTGHTHLICN